MRLDQSAQLGRPVKSDRVHPVAACETVSRSERRSSPAVATAVQPALDDDWGKPSHGSRPSANATLIERTGRFTVLVALPDGIKVDQGTHI